MKRRADLGALREVLHERNVTSHPPPDSLYSHTTSFRFPEVVATSLAGEEVKMGTGEGRLFAGKWTLVGCAGSNFAQGMVDAWLTGVVEEASADHAGDGNAEGDGALSSPLLQTSWLSLVEGTILGWLRRPLLASMRRGVPTERHDRFLCRFDEDTSELRRCLQMSNRYLGYVCLVDPQGSVRWHVHGNELPSADELSSLKKLLDGAMRFEQQQAQKQESRPDRRKR